MRPCTLTFIFLACSAAAHAGDDRFEQTVAADPKGTVDISNVSGKIEVEGWDQSQVRISARLDSDRQKVEVETDRGRISITVRLPSSFFGGGDAELKVKVPRGSEVDATAVSADVTSTGVTGAQRLKSVSGSITADVGQGDIEAKTVSGDVVLRGGQGGKPSQLHLTSISGSIRLEHGSGDVEANSTSGNVSVQLDTARSVRLRTISGEMSLRGKLTRGADVDAQTVSGGIRMKTDSESGFEYDVSTFSGSIGNCFNAKSERTSQYAPGERLSGSLGKGDAHVRLKSMSGNLELCDKQ